MVLELNFSPKFDSPKIFIFFKIKVPDLEPVFLFLLPVSLYFCTLTVYCATRYLQEHHRRYAPESHYRVSYADVANVFPQRLAHPLHASGASFDANQVFHLRHHDENGRGRREPRAYGHGYEVDDHAETRQTHQQLNDAGSEAQKRRVDRSTVTDRVVRQQRNDGARSHGHHFVRAEQRVNERARKRAVQAVLKNMNTTLNFR